MKLKNMFAIATITLPLLTTGCAPTLSSTENREYSRLQSHGLLIEEKNPALGAGLGLLPGGGSFYARSPGIGTVNLLLWPASILWDPFSGYVGSKAINYDTTKVSLSRTVSKEIAAQEDRLQAGEIDAATYIREKQKIEAKYRPY